MNIPYGRQNIEEDDIRAVNEVLRSDFITTGPKVAEFEASVCAYTGAAYAVAVSSGTAALHAACFAAGIEAGDEVITSPMTFAASANCVLYCGGIPVFADIDPETYNIDPDDVRRKITKKTRAVIAVHYAGQPCAMDEIRAIAEEYGLLVIEDAAHALGADYKGTRVGNISDMATFSFHPVKHITTGEGGMITTGSKELYERLKLFRSHGITRDRKRMSKFEGGWFYQQLSLGYNYRITDIQCALGISQMKKLDRYIARRKEIVSRYNDAFKDTDGIICPAQKRGCNNSWHLYVIQVLGGRRKYVYDRLQAEGIQVNVHYIPVYQHPYYRENGYRNTCCPNAEALYENIISLPLYYGLKDEEQEYVIQKVLEAIEE